MPVGGPRQRCVLGALLVDVGKEVPIDRLISHLWGDDPPRTARSVVQVQISHLRRAFPGTIVTTPGGYLADVDPVRVDLHRFRAHVARAQAAAGPAEAVADWDRALECWRGRPFSGTGSERLWYALGQPLLEERWAAVAAWAECASALRRHTEVVTRLSPLVREEPLRERLRYLLISSLYRSGQRAAALAAYEDNRRHLAEELGVDPSPELVELHQRILTDTEGEPEPAPTPSVLEETAPQQVLQIDAAAWSPRNDLPRDIPDFTGRQEDLGRLLATGEQGADVHVVTGPGGVGKTALAVRAAHRMAGRYPDGQLFIDLYGYSPDQEPLRPEAALGALLRATGVPPEAVPESLEERSALWRARLADRRVLVVLDNAVGHAQVAALLTAGPGSLTLVTTRNDLPGLGGAGYVSLGMLGEDESMQLLGTVLGTGRVERERDAAAEVVRQCGGLPLALRIVTGRMLSRPRWTFAHVAQRLSEQRRRFRELQVEGQSVEAVFELSYLSLTPEQQRSFCLLGMMIGGSVDLFGAAALLDMEAPDADDLLQELVSVCLLDEPGADHYRFHDLIGVYARHKAKSALPEKETDAARWRLAEYYLGTANRAADFLGPRAHEYEVSVEKRSRYESEITERSQAVSWFDIHQDNLASVVDFFASVRAGEHAWQIADSVWLYYASHGRTELLLATQEKALEVSRRQGNERGSAVTLVGLGIAQFMAGRFNLALDLLNDAREILDRMGDHRGLIRVDANLGMIYERLGRFAEALASLERVLGFAEESGDRRLILLQTLNIGAINQVIGEYGAAIAAGRAVLGAAEEDGGADLRSPALRVIGESSAGLGDHEAAVQHLEEAVAVAREDGNHSDEIYALNGLAIALRGSGRGGDAVDAHQSAYDLGRRAGVRNADAEILTELGRTLAVLGRREEARTAQEKALRIARERKERYPEARALLGLGLLDREEGAEATAEDRLTAAAALLGELGVPEAAEARAALNR
ncbi:BTAD domain-containing putative transcriptional regulator [Nocardiopsis sp. CNT-189]|uniref:AfsR/SARP family transcriptional regulator n=1 Tax=Nocardiopsis oceanisediminis TaxID=2816862 RepID=UPI003B3AC0D1